MWPTRAHIAQDISNRLRAFAKVRAMPGIATAKARDTLAWQMVSSLRRLDYTRLRVSRDISPSRSDPMSAMFDPEVAAIAHLRAGDLDEAFWLTFLATHFGKHGKHGWALLKGVYAGSGGKRWTWKRVTTDPAKFYAWVDANAQFFPGAFSNHRKYESLKPGPKGTSAVVKSYLDWVGPKRSHAYRVNQLVREAGNDPHTIFDHFYKTLKVQRFGRLAKFDFLALVGRLGLAPIEPGKAYIRASTGPKAGVRLLFLGNAKDKSADADLDDWVVELGAALGLGMQVMEDSICNWQKSPAKFVHFTG